MTTEVVRRHDIYVAVRWHDHPKEEAPRCTIQTHKSTSDSQRSTAGVDQAKKKQGMHELHTIRTA